MRLDQYINRLSKVSKNPSKWFFEILQGRENYVLAIPKRRLSLLGTDAYDKKITPSYSKPTIERKSRKGQRTGNVTLKDSGALHKSFKLISNQNSIDFTASASYLSDLTNHYSSNELIGFSPKDEEQIFKLFIVPEFNSLINGAGDIEIEI